MSKFFYDCEFHEDGKTIDLISIGIVNYETGETFYAVSNEFDTSRVATHWWLMENVMSSIDHESYAVVDAEGFPVYRDFDITDQAAMSREEIKRGVLEFVGQGQPAELWAWYSAYDHVCLAQLFGKMIDLPSEVPMVTYDIKQLHKLAGYCDMPKQPEGLHNALEDAKFNIVRYNYLKEVLDGNNLRKAEL
jgi:hypothetical protein